MDSAYIEKESPVTLDIIAEAARVGKSTVSLALRDHPKISEKTRLRIKKLAQDMGYRPNPLISAHMAHVRRAHPKNTGNVLAFITNRSQESVEADHLRPIREYFHGARNRANALGFRLDFFNIGDAGMTEKRLSQILAARGIYGIIIGPLSDGRGLEHFGLNWENFASVMIEHTFIQPQLHRVCLDEFSTIGRMIQRLLDLGFKRIGIALQSQMDQHANHLWLAGYEAYQALTEPKNHVPHFITDDWDSQAFLKWFTENRPDAIITCNDKPVQWLETSGYQIPDDVSCVSLYWRESRSYLSGLYQNHELMAANAVDLIVAQLNRNERGLPENPKTVLVQAEWREGKTLRRQASEGFVSPLRVWTR